ncbi:MAG: response regulator transcription factor [Melioribacteraceae bacterium]|nr:response regulator transcription factor [Melioribacteraceae bacterium]MCF8356879.1 response regulator transcription factor [Melioribacteraceae bacterium]MCF8395191.1 response regulator transcription factor [Melioribacteraceae bacterium]MCF8420035.1 response regulator transcription factor [Melioribacteraceae bacterium]
MINIIIVEDNDTIREGLKILIDGTDDYNCTATFSNCEDLLKKIKKLKFDIVLMDIDLPGMSGIEGIKILKQMNKDVIILVLTIYDENELVFDALCAGASGYLVKKTPPARLLEAIREAYDGGAPMSSQIARKVVNFFQQNRQIVHHDESSANLTPREKEVLGGLVEGHSIKAIADSLFISIETVRFHFRNIYKKLHVHSQSEAVVKAIKEGLV